MNMNSKAIRDAANELYYGAYADALRDILKIIEVVEDNHIIPNAYNDPQEVIDDIKEEVVKLLEPIKSI